jgi:cation diffusion facilitator family transporter
MAIDQQAQRIASIQKLSIVAVAGNALLAAGMIILGILFRSMAVVGNGIDSSSDIVTSLVTLFTSRIIERPPDREHPYGHARAENLATKIVSFIVFFAGAQLFITSLEKLFSETVPAMPSTAALIVTGGAIVGKIILAFILLVRGKAIESSMIRANGKNMLSDVVMSLGVLTGLGAVFLFQMPIIDVIIAVAISAFVMKTGIEIFMSSFGEVMDSVNDPTIYQHVFDAVNSVKGACNPHRTRIRMLGNQYIVDMDIEVDGGLSVTEGHGIAMGVERAVKNHIPNIYDVIVHVEPLGNYEKEERFGLKEE